MITSTLSNLHPLVLFPAAILFGLCIGSFLNVVIHRLPRMIDPQIDGGETDQTRPAPNLFSPPSSCPQCHTQLRVRDNIPVVSYVALRGRCAHCGARISPRYPLVELLGAALCVFVVMTTPVSAAMFGILVFSFGLLALLFIDLEHYLLPDLITLPLMWCGLLFNISGTFVDLPSAVIGAVCGYLVLWSVFHVFRLLTGKEGLGYGDFKLVAAIGAWLGWQMLPLVILIASVVGAVVGGIYLAVSKRGRDHPIPFGPFLAGAGWLAMFWGEEMIDLYFQFAGIA
jgi:leader peptidase (prepilin peptidase) / N-methyltransferase